MTAPRRILPGATYLVTRRCAQRQFLLRPSRATNDLFRYLLAHSCRRFGVLLHAYCVMSNHYHLVVTDPEARLPAFQQYLDSLLARALNASYGRWEAFWAPASYSAVELATPADVVAKAAYVLANPVSAGLVRRGDLWPGLRSAPGQAGASSITARRPEGFFDARGYMPEEVELALTTPAGFETDEDYRRCLVEAVEGLESAAARGRLEFLGPARVLAQRATDRPKGAERRRGLNPRVAASDRWRRAEVLGRLAAFARAYGEALAAWREGAREAVFPAGTYLMRVVHGVACQSCGAW